MIICRFANRCARDDASLLQQRCQFEMNGRTTRVTHVIRDVDERERGEKERRNSNTRLESRLRSSAQLNVRTRQYLLMVSSSVHIFLICNIFLGGELERRRECIAFVHSISPCSFCSHAALSCSSASVQTISRLDGDIDLIFITSRGFSWPGARKKE